MSNEVPPTPGSKFEPAALQPLRAESINYYNPSQYAQRPGILTAIGIISVVLAGWGLLANFAGLGSAILMRSLGMSGSTMSRTTYSTGATTIAVADSPGGIRTPSTAPSRMSEENRRQVIRIFTEINTLSSVRQRMLDRLLRATGDDPFPFNEASFTYAKLHDSVSSSGTNANADGSRSYFVTPNGRIEISDSDAVYSPLVGSAIEVSNNTSSGPIGPFPAQRSNVSVNFASGMSSPGITGLQIILAVVNLALSAFLLYCGIKVLKDSPKGRPLHLIYVALKLIAIILGTGIGWIASQQFYSSLGNNTPFGSAFVLVALAISLVIALIYPVSLLIVMTRPSIKAYYGSQSAQVSARL